VVVFATTFHATLIKPVLLGGKCYASKVCNAVQEDAKHWDTVTVEQGDFHKALGSLTPSLSQDELARYAALRNKFLSL
jgi:hypothetical protein